MSATTFDYIIIGGGTAGALLCNRLSADRSKRVLLLEAGSQDNDPWRQIPMGYLNGLGKLRTDSLYQTETEAGLHSPRGRTLGDCSSSSSMLYLRGQARDYDQWAQLTGDDAWRWENSLPHFMRHEDHWRLDTPVATSKNFQRLHGSSGEWRVEKQRLRWEILDAFAEAALQAGIPASSDFNTGNNEGVGYFEVNQKAGWRLDTAKAFLRPCCNERANVAMWSMAQATKLLIECQPNGKQRCSGVEVAAEDGMKTVRATCEVLVCAGAINSPQLLQLSGIGPAALLREWGIPVIQDLPGVGANLQDHLPIHTVFKVQGTPTLHAFTTNLLGKARIGMEYALQRSSTMSRTASQLGAFTRSHPDLAHPNLQYNVQPLALAAFSEPPLPFPAFTASVCNLNPTSRGTVRIKSRDFRAAPAIAPHYLSTAEDRQVAVDSLRLTRRIVAQPALARFFPQEIKPGVQLQPNEDLTPLTRASASTVFHPVGTTKMGRVNGPDADPMAVLDSQLRVRGIAGLRVVDAGAIPTITSGNTTSPTLMMAEKVAEWILKGQPPPAARRPAVSAPRKRPQAGA